MMNASDRPATESVTYQWECARKIVSILLNETKLSTIIHMVPTVIVGEGNWISFAVSQAVSAEAVLRLLESPGKPTFVSDVFSRYGRARSKTTPSLHLTNLDSGEALQGHVDAYYWTKHPLGHAAEFLTKKTIRPSELLNRLS
jgi:hypothetical protein